MKKLLLLFTSLLSTCAGFAEVEARPCEFALEAELLYWAPSPDMPFWGQRGFLGLASSPNLVYLRTTQGYKPGFRINGLYAFNECNVFEVRFTYFNGGRHRLHFVDTNTVLPGGFQAADGEVDTKLNTRYYAADFTLQNFDYTCGNINVNFLEGIHYMWLREQFNLSTKGISIINFRNRSQVWGIGPEFGVNARYTLPNFNCGNLGLIGNARGALLASLSKDRFFFAPNNAGQTGVNENLWAVIPAFDFRLGLDWNTCFCGFNAYAEVGYEFVWYDNCLLTLTTVPNSIVSYKMSFQGPYLSIGASF